MMDKALQVLQKYFGYSHLREGQEKVIASLLQGSDTLAIMPTGAGKSLSYQIPALLFEGVTLVISPLISLMKDQVDALELYGVPATFINSSLTLRETRKRIEKASHGEYKLLYVAPERLETESFGPLLASLRISFVAIDEAHCVSQWGHDFRPSYLRLGPFLQGLSQRPLVGAFTATATAEVKQDIIRHLRLVNPKIFVTGFDRPNLTFSTLRGENKKVFLLQYVQAHPEQCGIVYAATRKEVDTLQAFLAGKGIKAGKYHAGMNDLERQQNQEDFLHDRVNVIVATNAFGMGIDKSNVRYVLHHNMPKTMEAYYQEAGRAGRDGEPAECILLFSPQDVVLQRHMIEQTTLHPERKLNELKKMQEMVDYCHTTRCLRKTIVEYFGEADVPEECGNCGNCKDDRETVDITIEAQKIFSCIYRMRERFGMNLVAEVLKGSRNKKVLELKFDRLSTYGLMRQVPVQEIKDCMNYLITENYLRLSTGEYPLVKLESKVVSVLKGEAKVFRKVLRKIEKKNADPQSLFERLRGLRRAIAAREKLPPYMIFADNTLREMAEVCPTERTAFLRINGVGERKLEKYGPEFLDEIQAFVQGQDTLERDQAAIGRNDAAVGRNEAAVGNDEASEGHGEVDEESQAESSVLNVLGVADVAGESGVSVMSGVSDVSHVSDAPSLKIASHVQTLIQYQEGKTLAEIAAVRKLSLTTVQEHLVRCHNEGHPIPWDDFIPLGQENLILDVIRQVGWDKLRPIKDILPEEIEWMTIKAVLAKNRANRA